jgi:carbon monoxide dehydrogenase subunit G
MARYVDVIDLPLPPEDAFDLLADFARTQDWDPGVVEAVRLDDGPLERGSRFHVVASFLGRRVPLEYEIREYERPRRLVLRASDGALTSLDEIHFSARSGGTRVSYEARLTLGGLAGLADPLLQLAFGFAGRAAARGLSEYATRLAGEQARVAAAGRERARAAGA